MIDSYHQGVVKMFWWQKYLMVKDVLIVILLTFLFTVKKKYGAGLKFSNLMGIGKKKPSSLESPEKCVDTSGEQTSPLHVKPEPEACTDCHTGVSEMKSSCIIFVSSVRLPQCLGEEPVAYLLVSYQEWAAVVLPGQGQEQGEPASRDPGGLQHFARPQPRAPVLLQDRHGRHAAGNPRGRQPLAPLLLPNIPANFSVISHHTWLY